MDKASPLTTRQFRRVHVIESPGIYKAKARPTAAQAESLENIQVQVSMVNTQEYGEEEAYQGGDAYSPDVCMCVCVCVCVCGIAPQTEKI